MFLEIHIGQGTPYSEEDDIISEVKVITPQVSGYMTTNLDLTWQGDPDRVLCSYTEDFVRVGSIVYITPTAPICCCPGSYTSQAREGNFMSFFSLLEVYKRFCLSCQVRSSVPLEAWGADHTQVG